MINIVVLAAGKGTRMNSKRPKVAHKIAGKPMINWVLHSSAPFQNNNTIIVVGHEAQAVEKLVSNQDGQNPKIVLQSPQLGTGHAVRVTTDLLNDQYPTLILYGDVPLIQSETLIHLVEQCKDNEMGLLTVKLVDPTGYGRVIRDSSGSVLAIVEQKDASAEQLSILEVNTGILAAPTVHLKRWLKALDNNNAQQEFYLTDIIAMANQDGIKVNTSSPRFNWETQGVNNKTQLAELENVWQTHQARQLMDKGVTIMDPQRIDIRGQLDCGQDVEIDVGCVFEGTNHLEDDVKIGPYCVIKNCSIGAGTVVQAFSHMDGAVIADQVQIGPYARLRPQTQLDSHAKVGNFVEIKKSQIGPSSKINHLSYIGDTYVEANVNVGAGVITCNYDGVNKHVTYIGEGAFIGSNCQLVAPVKVGKGATVGAGSTITKDTPDGKLTVARAKQVVIENWQRPTEKN